MSVFPQEHYSQRFISPVRNERQESNSQQHSKFLIIALHDDVQHIPFEGSYPLEGFPCNLEKAVSGKSKKFGIQLPLSVSVPTDSCVYTA